MVNDLTLETFLRSCVIAMRNPRGRFYPDKNFGSTLYALEDAENTRALLAAARQAVRELDGVFVKSASVDENSAVFEIYINNEKRRVSIELEQNL